MQNIIFNSAALDAVRAELDHICQNLGVIDEEGLMAAYRSDADPREMVAKVIAEVAPTRAPSSFVPRSAAVHVGVSVCGRSARDDLIVRV